MVDEAYPIKPFVSSHSNLLERSNRVSTVLSKLIGSGYSSARLFAGRRGDRGGMLAVGTRIGRPQAERTSHLGGAGLLLR
jgi:hypothetical protein